jgi:hypothetical protein
VFIKCLLTKFDRSECGNTLPATVFANIVEFFRVKWKNKNLSVTTAQLLVADIRNTFLISVIGNTCLRQMFLGLDVTSDVRATAAVALRHSHQSWATPKAVSKIRGSGCLDRSPLRNFFNILQMFEIIIYFNTIINIFSQK